MSLSKRVSKRILDLCKERRITLNRLATLSGLTQSTVDSIIRGKTKHPQLNTIHRICMGLGISLAEFFNSPEFIESCQRDSSNE